MRITFALGLLVLAGCGTDTFKGADDGGTDAAVDSTSMMEASADAGDAAKVVKPRMFVSVAAQQSALLVWDDPDAIAAPRMPSAAIPIAAALDVVVAKKRVFVAGGAAIFTFDKALELSSQSLASPFGKGSFIGLSQSDSLNVVALHWEPMLDILTTADDGAAALQTFKDASSMSIPPMAKARIFNDADNVLHPAMAPNGQAFASKNGGFTTPIYDNADTATGSVTSSNFVTGSGRMLTTNNRLFVPGVNLGIGGASVYVYTLAVGSNQQAAPEVHTAFGGPQVSDSAREVALNSNFLAVAVWKAMSGDSSICVITNPNGLSTNSTCDHTIPVSGKILRLKERNGSLYASIPGRLDIYRKPLTDTQPSVTLALGDAGSIATGIAFVDPN